MQIPALQPIQPTQQSHHNTPQTPIQFVVTSAKVHEHPSFSSVEEGKPQHQQQQKQNRTTAVISTKPTNILHNYQSMPNPNQMPKAKEQLEQIEQQTEQLQTDQIQQQTQQLQIDQKQTTEQIEPQTPNEGDEVTAKQQQQQQLETLQSKIEPQSESNQTQDDDIDENVIPVLQQKPSQYSNPSVLFSTNSNLAPTIENPPSPQGNQTQPEDVKIVKIPNPSEQRPQSTIKHFLITLELKNDGTQVVKVQVVLFVQVVL